MKELRKISSNQLNNIKQLLDTLKQAENEERKKILEEYVDDIDLFCEIFGRSYIKERPKACKSEQADSKFNKEEVDAYLSQLYGLFSNGVDIDEIAKKYSKSELTNMYIGRIGSKPLSKSSKKDLIEYLRASYRGEQRAKELHESNL